MPKKLLSDYTTYQSKSMWKDVPANWQLYIYILMRLSKKNKKNTRLFARPEGGASSQSGLVCFHPAFQTAFPYGSKSVEQMTKACS